MLKYLKSHTSVLPLSMDLLINENDFELKILANKITEELVRQAINEGRKRLMDIVQKARMIGNKMQL
jgi:hypothetical protein